MKMNHSKPYVPDNGKFNSAMWDVTKLKRVEETHKIMTIDIN